MTVDQYIQSFPAEIQIVLQQIREIIRKAAPDAEEVISYGMPAYKQNGMLVYFAGNKNHLGFYPTPSAVAAFSDELKPWKTTKGAVQFPYNEPLPVELIRKMVVFKVRENLHKRI